MLPPFGLGPCGKCNVPGLVLGQSTREVRSKVDAGNPSFAPPFTLQVPTNKGFFMVQSGENGLRHRGTLHKDAHMKRNLRI